jgi:hypothetical protein
MQMQATATSGVISAELQVYIHSHFFHHPTCSAA